MCASCHLPRCRLGTCSSKSNAIPDINHGILGMQRETRSVTSRALFRPTFDPPSLKRSVPFRYNLETTAVARLPHLEFTNLPSEN